MSKLRLLPRLLPLPVVIVNGESAGNASGSSTGGGDDNSEGGKKKRKKRWGEAARKNRFSNKDEDEVEGGADASGSGSPPTKARKSRWSSEATNSAAEAVPAAGAGTTGGVIPGMPVNLSQEQIQETLVLQVRLTQANEKLPIRGTFVCERLLTGRGVSLVVY